MAERLKEMKSRLRKEGGDAGQLRDREREVNQLTGQNEDLNRRLERLKNELEDARQKFDEKEKQLMKEKQENAEQNFKSIVELKAANQDKLEALKNDLREQEELVARLLGEQKEIKDYTAKLEREIFNLSQEKEKFEDNLKKVMTNWEHEELRRYNSERQLTGVLEDKDQQIDELKEKLNQVDNFHKDATEKISRNADFYKKKAESLEDSKNKLSKKVRELEATVKRVQEEADGSPGSHLNLQTVGARTMTERSNKKSKSHSKKIFLKDTTKIDSEAPSTGRGEAETLEERRERVAQVVSTTVRMDGDLVKMLYTQAKCIDERLFGDSEDEEEMEEVEIEVPAEPVNMHMPQHAYAPGVYAGMTAQEHSDEVDSRDEMDEEDDEQDPEAIHQNYQAYRHPDNQRNPAYHPVVDNTMSSNPEKMYVDATQQQEHSEDPKFPLESETEDGDKLMPAYLIDGNVYNIAPDGNIYDVQEIRQMMPKGPDQQGLDENRITQFQPNGYNNPNQAHPGQHEVEEEYSDMEEDEEDQQPQQQFQGQIEGYHNMPQKEQIRVGHRVAGPIPGNQMPAEVDYEGQYEEYEQGDYEEDYEEEEEDEEVYDEDEVRQGAESGGFGQQGYEQGEGRYAAQDQGFGRQPGPTFGVGKQ